LLGARFVRCTCVVATAVAAAKHTKMEGFSVLKFYFVLEHMNIHNCEHMNIS
jgi:hypothetical protein